VLDCEDLVSTGVFQPELSDPDLCNPFTSGLWELVPLMHHYDKGIVKVARKLAAGDFSKTIFKK
jgi:hypothetical protein